MAKGVSSVVLARTRQKRDRSLARNVKAIVRPCQAHVMTKIVRAKLDFLAMVRCVWRVQQANTKKKSEVTSAPLAMTVLHHRLVAHHLLNADARMDSRFKRWDKRAPAKTLTNVLEACMIVVHIGLRVPILWVALNAGVKSHFMWATVLSATLKHGKCKWRTS
jgi:hypothetical protein